MSRQFIDDAGAVLNLDRLAQVHRFYQTHAEHISSPEFAYAEALIRYLHASISGLEDAVTRGRPHTALACLEIADPPRSSEARTAFALVQGKFWSLVDRDMARASFRQAIDSDDAGHITSFFVDTGVHTYFSEKEICKAEPKLSIDMVTQTIEPLSDGSAHVSRQTIACAMDPMFFRTYAPLLFFHAQHLPDLDFVVILCADPSEVAKCVHDGAKLAAVLSDFSGLTPSKNVKFWQAPVPSFVMEDKTFYASARFFAASRLLEHYERVYLMDADLTLTRDPRPYMEANSSPPFASSARTRGLAGLSPWRRFTAGSIILDTRSIDSGILEDLHNYLLVGLQRGDSWMLDQNALSFAIERHLEIWGGLENRPAMQPSIRSIWERNIRALSASRAARTSADSGFPI
ncbi:hypothetical protein [Ornithinimicrobium sp. Y1694]|uniref:hypothetical protein n=1 Tax=Ornithinimicrobium sp. Y1694 TaxID=3418590 RepID=UPI003CEF14FB